MGKRLAAFFIVPAMLAHACSFDDASPANGSAGASAQNGGAGAGGDLPGSSGNNSAGSSNGGAGGSDRANTGAGGGVSTGAGGTTSGGALGDASSPGNDASTVVPMHPGQCIYPPTLAQRKAPAWPPTQIVNPKGLIFRFMNNCPMTLWAQVAGVPGGVVELATKTWKEYDLPNVNGRISVFENAAPGQAGSYQINFMELNARPGMALNYNLSNVDWVGLPVEVNGIGTDRTCGVTACYTPLANMLNGCPPSLVDNTHHTCQAPKNYCSSPAHATEALCTALDQAGAAAIMSDPKCTAGGSLAQAGSGSKIYGCAGFWGGSPYCCAKVNRGYGGANNDNTQNCNYYKTEPYSSYSKYAQTVCPYVYSFAYDDVNDQSGFHTCNKGTELDVTWCPGDP